MTRRRVPHRASTRHLVSHHFAKFLTVTGSPANLRPHQTCLVTPFLKFEQGLLVHHTRKMG